MTARYLVGDVRQVIREIPDGSIDLVLTSWPYLALRSYLPDDHANKESEIGSEATPAEFIDTLLGITAEFRRVLAPHGSMATELGDTFSGSGGAGGDYGTRDPGHVGLREGQSKFAGSAIAARRTRNAYQGTVGWPRPKCLVQVPELYRVALAYGVHPLTGDESPAGQWLVRNVVVHARPNPPVGALGDKWRPACSYWAVACTTADRWFDLAAVSKRSSREGAVRRNTRALTNWFPSGYQGRQAYERPMVSEAGAPPLDWHRDQYDDDAWHISTQPYKGSHYAVFSPELVKKFVLSMCPSAVCRTCGKPRERITERSEAYANARAHIGDFKAGRGRDTGLNGSVQYFNGQHIKRAEHITTGFTDCGHNDYRRGVVLDPFGGSGTTGMVAESLGRDSILIDIDEHNLALARARIASVGLLQTDETTDEVGQAALFDV